MRVRMTGLAGVIAIAALLVGAAPASAAPGDASAYGARLNVTLLGNPAVNAEPFAAANANGPKTQNTFAGVDLTGILKTGVINASATIAGARNLRATTGARLNARASDSGTGSRNLYPLCAL